MGHTFSEAHFFSFLVRGDLQNGLRYLEQFPCQEQELRKYHARFDGAHSVIYPVDEGLQHILALYQQYYRDVFYLPIGSKQAEETMASNLRALFQIDDLNEGIEAAEEKVTEAFSAKGFHILCGRTGGFYGPYIWTDTESRTFDVELPGGMQKYTVNLLDGFISKSWLDYISFGKIGTGGWTDSSGVINCIRASYDLESEHFRVSLLKHEAQHARDLIQYPDMSSADLEYRAKLVELIYSSDPGLLDRFIAEADPTRETNGHGLASARIAAAFSGTDHTIAQIQSAARRFFQSSSEEILHKYG